jgi:hypothetical protein
VRHRTRNHAVVRARLIASHGLHEIVVQLAEALILEETKDAGAATAWGCAAGDIEEMIAERFADLFVLDQFETENPPLGVFAAGDGRFWCANTDPSGTNNGAFSAVGKHAPSVGTAAARPHARDPRCTSLFLTATALSPLPKRLAFRHTV